MTFSSAHYVPILKVKKGEKEALSAIAPQWQTWITPLLEVVEIGEKKVKNEKKGRKKTLQEHLDTTFDGLAPSVQPYGRCLIDTLELEPHGSQAAEEVFLRATSEGMRFTPVTGISRSHDVQAALAHRAHGLAIRLTRQEFESGRLKSRLDAFLRRHGLLAQDIDLIVDLGELDSMVVDGVTALAQGFLAEIPEPSIWRTLTLSGCAFPKSMKVVHRLAAEHLPRLEWAVWRDSLHKNRIGLERLPTFSDCGIQHSSGVEGFDHTTMTAAAAVRYALGDAWLLIKGESTRVRPTKEQFPELAARLVYGEQRADFIGEGHCRGCAGIKSAADGGPNLGSAGVWRRLGTIHHITRTVEALVGLPWP